MKLKRNLDLSGQHWHFIGILGTGMNGLASYAAERGACISGSDVRPSEQLQRLLRRGITVKLGQNRSHLDPRTNLVVVSQAVAEDNPELVQAHRLGLEVLTYPELLGLLMEKKEGVAVAGSHGKSTTASAVAYVMSRGGLDPSFLIGADIPQLGGGSHYGEGRILVAEACEYKRSFLNLRPRIGVITNVDLEHVDYYYDLWDVQDAFCDFACRVHGDGALVINADDPNSNTAAEAAHCRPVRCSLESRKADYTIRKLWRATRHSNFDVVYRGKDLGRFYTRLFGMHNVMNALLAIATCHCAGMSFDAIREALPDFVGPARRLQLLGEPWNVPVLSDYAHHPKEIRATIAAARQRFPDHRMFCVFQPHQYSRTRAMLPELAASFEGVHLTLVSDIYAARDSEEDRQAVSALDLVRAINQHGEMAYFVPEFADIEDMVVGETVTGDMVLVMGAGSVSEVAYNIVRGIAGKPETQIAA